jgi:hypothetical protein
MNITARCHDKFVIFITSSVAPHRADCATTGLQGLVGVSAAMDHQLPEALEQLLARNAKRALKAVFHGTV